MKKVKLKTGDVDKVYRYLFALKLVYIIGSIWGGFLFPVYYDVGYNVGNVLAGISLFVFFGFFIFPVFALQGKIIPIIVTICLIYFSIMITRDSVSFSSEKNVVRF